MILSLYIFPCILHLFAKRKKVLVSKTNEKCKTTVNYLFLGFSYFYFKINFTYNDYLIVFMYRQTILDSIMTYIRTHITFFLKTEILKYILRGNEHSEAKQKERNMKNKVLKLTFLGSCTNHSLSVQWFLQT